MPIEIVEMASWGSAETNEDRCGHAGAMAWVIDGATDLVDAPLVGEVSDAAWLAEHAHQQLHRLSDNPPPDLTALPQLLNAHLAKDFYSHSRIQPSFDWQHPSASALIVRAGKFGLEWIGLGDCALIAETGGSLTTIGISGENAGDRETACEVSRLHNEHGVLSEAERRALIWPRIREERAARLNKPGGNGVLSITPPPAELIAHGNAEMQPRSHALIASDGLIRLIDIYARYDSRSLLEAVKLRGLDPLLTELRQIETTDADCSRHPRVKQLDDATGILLRYV
ncbi:MAG: protein phosphatase 2C domain-containing protein [Alphaproteobacteria bacterium]|nr:protein phosphatase 2C domain-containing protein [Alphaproteobacteria bacterium]